MSAGRAVGSFPWDAVSRTSKRSERQLANARRALAASVDSSAFAAELAKLIGVPVEVVLRGVSEQAPIAASFRLGFATSSSLRLGVALEAPLASALLAAFLRRPMPIVPAELSPDPALLGALSALLMEAARATGGTEPLRPVTPASAPDAVFVHATVIVRGRPYAASIWFERGLLTEPSNDGQRLAELGALDLALPLVIGAGLSTPRDLSNLSPGAAFCPEIWVRRDGVGRAVLAAGTSEAGIAAELLPGGEIVVGEPTKVPLVTPESMVKSDAQSPSGIEQAVLDAPVVVRVELASVSLSAREWANLKTGDVIETRRRIGGPVTLRSGGRALAHGELVNIDGELGVRVTRLLPEETP